MLRCDGLRVDLGDFTLRADLEVAGPGITAVIGPSGSGKSTFLAAVSGFVPLSAGQVYVEGEEIGVLPPEKRPVAMIFQDNNLFPHLDAARNVALAITQKARLTTEESALVDAALARVGLSGLGARRPAELSGGQQSRVALARVLLQRRPLVLLDEPFSALGPALRGEMLDLVADVAADIGAQVLMVTHDPGDAARVAPQTVVVMEGTVAPPRPTAALLADPPPALKGYLGG